MSGIGKGYVQIYTGNGKGKTTAALGLALRAAGHGLRTYFVQFMKGQSYGELEAVQRLGGLVTIEQYGHAQFCRMTDPPAPRDVERARAACARVEEILSGKICDILVADEIITAMAFGLISEENILAIIAKKPAGLELVLTGRGATAALIEAADLVTEMQDIRHYYSKGVLARKGIES